VNSRALKQGTGLAACSVRSVRRASGMVESGNTVGVQAPDEPWSEAPETTLRGEQHAPERPPKGEASPQEVGAGRRDDPV
jgi:hypothetical protein